MSDVITIHDNSDKGRQKRIEETEEKLRKLDEEYGYDYDFRVKHDLPHGCELVTVTKTHYDYLQSVNNLYNAAARDSRDLGEWLHRIFPQVINGEPCPVLDGFRVSVRHPVFDIAEAYLSAGLFQLVRYWWRVRAVRRRILKIDGSGSNGGNE